MKEMLKNALKALDDDPMLWLFCAPMIVLMLLFSLVMMFGSFWNGGWTLF